MLILLNAFPSLLSMFAIYKLMNPIGLVDSRLGLIIIYTGTMAVFGLWNMKGYFDTIPYDIEEAARMDGASELQIIRRIVMPLAETFHHRDRRDGAHLCLERVYLRRNLYDRLE
jgi:arabinogalactan oligomer/maltooligosaccharide transport system permease protein